MLIDDSGPKIDEQALAAIENLLSARLPDSYRQFLLQYNGGIPTPDTVDVPGMSGTPTDVQVFFGFGRSIESSDLKWNFSLIAERCLSCRLLPIACDSGGNLFCLKVNSGLVSEVIYCDLDVPGCRLYAVAPSFEEFIASIRSFSH